MRATLAAKVSLTIAGVVILAMFSSGVGLALLGHFERVTQSIAGENLRSVRAAQELRIALLDQRGYVSAYVLDGGNRRWLQELKERETSFHSWLNEARESDPHPESVALLDQIDRAYRQYQSKRYEVIETFDRGDVESARDILLNDVSGLYDQASHACETFMDANNDRVNDQTRQIAQQVSSMSAVVLTCTALTVGLGALLLWMFFRRLFWPLRQLAADAESFVADRDETRVPPRRGDELQSIGDHLRALMLDVAATRSSLEQQETEMRQIDKLASVGRLAASVAHEIRNPLTSIKMWLFSMRQAVGQSPDLHHKFEVVSGEINRLENIVQNFLDFSRQPNLKLLPKSITPLVDKTLEVFRFRFVQQGVTLQRRDEPNLPLVMLDPEQMMQVLVNLLDNALSAMAGPGQIRIHTDAVDVDSRRMVRVRISDTGPGFPTEVRDRMFDPFFTTKEEGTGLGLPIAASIMAQHGGRLVPENSSPEGGATFTLWIPAITDHSPDG